MVRCIDCWHLYSDRNGDYCYIDKNAIGDIDVEIFCERFKSFESINRVWRMLDPYRTRKGDSNAH